MRNFLISLVGLMLLISNQVAVASAKADNQEILSANPSGAVKVSSSSSLTPMVTGWVNGFNVNNQEVKAVMVGQGVTGSNCLAISTEPDLSGRNTDQWSIVIGRDVFVPIINAQNPLLPQLLQNGISISKLQMLLNSTESQTWANLVTNGSNKKVTCLIAEESDLVAALSQFSKTNQLKSTSSTSELFTRLKQDALAIGFCKLSDLKIAFGSNLESVKLLPIDKNGNGRLDTFENIYSNMTDFVHGVWIGKYPSVLTSDIYASGMTKPSDKQSMAFINWILSDGQKSLAANGYCELTTTEKQAGLAVLSIGKPQSTTQSEPLTRPFTLPVVLTIFAVMGLFALIFIVSKSGAENVVTDNEIQIAPMLIENAVDVPKGLYFDKSHTWAFMETDGNVKVGMDDFLQHITGKLTKIKMKEIGETVRKGEKIVTIIREGKQLSLYAPISGTIISQNELLHTDSSLLNSSPYNNGWVYQIEPKNWLREIQFMLMGERYAEWLRDEFVRLRDFIAASVKNNQLAYAQVVLQDGGELTDNVLADMDPKVWEDFQTRFIDVAK